MLPDARGWWKTGQQCSLNQNELCFPKYSCNSHHQDDITVWVLVGNPQAKFSSVTISHPGKRGVRSKGFCILPKIGQVAPKSRLFGLIKKVTKTVGKFVKTPPLMDPPPFFVKTRKEAWSFPRQQFSTQKKVGFRNWFSMVWKHGLRLLEHPMTCKWWKLFIMVIVFVPYGSGVDVFLFHGGSKTAKN